MRHGTQKDLIALSYREDLSFYIICVNIMSLFLVVILLNAFLMKVLACVHQFNMPLMITIVTKCCTSVHDARFKFTQHWANTSGDKTSLFITSVVGN
jgi:hypothetical protein